MQIVIQNQGQEALFEYLVGRPTSLHWIFQFVESPKGE